MKSDRTQGEMSGSCAAAAPGHLFAGMLEFPCDVERLPSGNTLITDAGDETGVGSEVIEVDALGQIVWRYGELLQFAHAARRLSNGNTLIADTNNNRIIEVTMQGEVCFSTESWQGGGGWLSDGTRLDYPNDVHLLASDALLITDRNNDRVVKCDRSGKVLWQFSGAIRHPHNADPVDGGNILLVDSDNRRVVEVDSAGEVVWSYEGTGDDRLDFPRDADRLANGNTLITDSRNHRVIEVDQEGSIVWKYQADHYASFYEADRLENGNTLIADQHHHRIIEVDAGGRLVWEFRNRRWWKRTFPRLYNGSFAKRTSRGEPEGWYLYNRFAEGSGAIDWDDEGHVGLRNAKKGGLCLVQYITVRPGARYTMAGELRTEAIEEGGSAYLQVFFLDEYGGPVANTAEAPKGNLLVGTTPWTREQFVAKAPAVARTAEVRVFINRAGSVYARNLFLFE